MRHFGCCRKIAPLHPNAQLLPFSLPRPTGTPISALPPADSLPWVRPRFSVAAQAAGLVLGAPPPASCSSPSRRDPPPARDRSPACHRRRPSDRHVRLLNRPCRPLRCSRAPRHGRTPTPQPLTPPALLAMAGSIRGRRTRFGRHGARFMAAGLDLAVTAVDSWSRGSIRPAPRSTNRGRACCSLRRRGRAPAAREPRVLPAPMSSSSSVASAGPASRWRWRWGASARGRCGAACVLLLDELRRAREPSSCATARRRPSSCAACSSWTSVAKGCCCVRSRAAPGRLLLLPRD